MFNICKIFKCLIKCTLKHPNKTEEVNRDNGTCPINKKVEQLTKWVPKEKVISSKRTSDVIF